MKKLISIFILISIISAFAQVKFGMQMRMRSELQNLNSTDADKQVYDRMVDVRLRPDVSYTVNDYLSVKAVFEIGDVKYGTDGGAIGTDGKNLETKNVYIDVKPTQNHAFRIGLMPIKDEHSFIIDTDLAGILWMGKFEKYAVDLGWFAALDNEEFYNNNDDNTYSFGTTLVSLNQSYQWNKYLTLGVYNLFVLDRTEYMDGVTREGVSIYFAPRADINIGKFHVNGQFVANNKYADYKNIGDNPAYTDEPWDPDKTGLGLSIKSRFEMDSKTTFRANLLFRGCYENWENYEAYKSFYDTGLEILNENTNGIYSHNPMNAFTIANGFQLGVVVPSIFVDWKYMDNVTLTGAFGFIMNDQSYDKAINVYDPAESLNEDMLIAWEIDLKAKVVLYDNIQIFPYFAFFVPTDNFAYNTVNNTTSPINFKDGEPATDVQIKVGTTIKYNF